MTVPEAGPGMPPRYVHPVNTVKAQPTIPARDVHPMTVPEAGPGMPPRYVHPVNTVKAQPTIQARYVHPVNTVEAQPTLQARYVHQVHIDAEAGYDPPTAPGRRETRR
jgi:hypothetical protein